MKRLNTRYNSAILNYRSLQQSSHRSNWSDWLTSSHFSIQFLHRGQNHFSSSDILKGFSLLFCICHRLLFHVTFFIRRWDWCVCVCLSVLFFDSPLCRQGEQQKTTLGRPFILVLVFMSKVRYTAVYTRFSHYPWFGYDHLHIFNNSTEGFKFSLLSISLTVWVLSWILWMVFYWSFSRINY